ncbi:c-type cytochrome [Niveibacterium sp. SC-1]|uniref:c-type cytochrome n=1 Tax=Niveibacterium sp. SC-1 TaxID=3135646 RepID=UPI00311DF3BB
MNVKAIAGMLGLAAVGFLSPAAYAVDADAAQALAKKEGCMKCHALDKEKDASSFKKIAGKWAGKPDAEAKLIHHITSGEKVKMADGTEEDHKIIKTKDADAQKNLVDWILSLK